MSDKGIHSIDRGTTYYAGRTIDTASYSGVHLEGQLKTFRNTKSSYEITTPSDGIVLRNEKDVTLMLVRNTSGVTLLAKRAVIWASGQRGKRVDGYVKGAGFEVAGIVDDHYGSAGIPNGDLFYIVVAGECLCTTSPAASTAENFINMHDILYAQTAAASTHSTTAGRVIPWDTTSITTGTTAMLLAMNYVGRAMSAKTSANSDADILVELVRRL